MQKRLAPQLCPAKGGGVNGAAHCWKDSQSSEWLEASIDSAFEPCSKSWVRGARSGEKESGEDLLRCWTDLTIWQSASWNRQIRKVLEHVEGLIRSPEKSRSTGRQDRMTDWARERHKIRLTIRSQP